VGGKVEKWLLLEQLRWEFSNDQQTPVQAPLRQSLNVLYH